MRLYNSAARGHVGGEENPKEKYRHFAHVSRLMVANLKSTLLPSKIK